MKRHYFKRNTMMLMVSLAVSGGSGGASADGLTLEEIVVTAQRRSENLQDVPISVSAFTSEGLENAGIRGTLELTYVTPGLQMTQQMGMTLPTLRGVGVSTSSPGSENPISTYVDGVYLRSMASSNFSFNNIDRIEVLKGPQGTLFGRNATGGLINVITKVPTQDASGSVELLVGNYESVGLNAYFSGGLTETIAADLAIIYQDQSDDFGTNIGTGSGRGYYDTEGVRTKIVFDPAEDTRIKLGLMYSEAEGDLGISRQIAEGALGVFGTADYSGDWQDINSDFDPVTTIRNWSASLHVEHSFDSFDLLSITAYQENHTLNHLDQDAAPFNVVNAGLTSNSEAFTQEFQISSNDDGSFQWIVGAFFMDSQESYDTFNITGLGLQLDPNFPLLEVDNSPSQDTKSYAVFAQGYYDFTEATGLTVGLRYTKDEREATTDTNLMLAEDNPLVLGGLAPAGVLLPFDQGELDETWTEPTWRIALDHKFTDDVLVYASYSRGFNSGLYNLVSVSTDPANPSSLPTDPETIDAYELGVKADLLDGRLRVNGAIFYYDYQDIQQAVTEAGSNVLVNAAEAEITGAEAEVTWLATEALTLTAGLSLLDTEYTKWPNADVFVPSGVGGNVRSTVDVSGEDLVRSPDLTFNVGVNYSIPASNGTYATHLNYYYNDGFNWDPLGRLNQDSYEVVNLELSWLGLNETWRARIYGRNLTDEEYSNVSDTGALGDAVSASPPRTYGVAIQYSF